MTWVNDRCEPRSTLGWKWMICRQYLGESNENLQQTKKGLRSSNHGEVIGLGLGYDLLYQQGSKHNLYLSACVSRVIRHLFRRRLQMGPPC
jgi:hypothetical protein